MQVPAQFFLHFLAKLQVQANSVRDMPHKGLPVYKSNTRKVSYKMFQLEKLQNALDEEGLVQYNTNILYTGQTQSSNEANRGTADEEIARAKQKGPINGGSKVGPLQNPFWWLEEVKGGPLERWR